MNITNRPLLWEFGGAVGKDIHFATVLGRGMFQSFSEALQSGLLQGCFPCGKPFFAYLALELGLFFFV
jgi:hypothetical protein